MAQRAQAAFFPMAYMTEKTIDGMSHIHNLRSSSPGRCRQTRTYFSLYPNVQLVPSLCVCVHACSKQWCGNRRAFAIYRMRDKSMWNALSGIYAYCAVILPLAKLYYIHTLTMCYCSFKCLAKVSARLCVQANAQFIICVSVCVCGEGGDGGGWAVGRTSVCECRRRHCSEKERLRPDQMLENRNAPEFIQSLCVERTTVLHTVHVRNDCDCDTNRGETV